MRCYSRDIYGIMNQSGLSYRLLLVLARTWHDIDQTLPVLGLLIQTLTI
jgi:hypothetical protein